MNQLHLQMSCFDVRSLIDEIKGIVSMKKTKWIDPLFKAGTGVLAWSIVVVAVFLVVILFRFSLPALKTFGFPFLWTSEWDAVRDRISRATR